MTIFGQSAGGMSVACHLTSPASEPLFARAIVQSDPLALPFRTTKNYPSFTKEVAKKAKCAKALSGKPYEGCMRGLTWEEVVDAQDAAQKDLLVEVGHFLDLFVPFSPTVGTADLPRQPFEAIVSGEMQDKPVVLGSVANEGVIFVHEAFSGPESRTEEDGLLSVAFGLSTLPQLLKAYPRSGHDKAAHDMRNHTSRVSTDALFHCSIRHAALALTAQPNRTSPTWVYHFEHVPSFPSIWMPNFPYCADVVCHAAELPFLFRANTSLAFANVSLTPGEAVMAEQMQTYWAQFANDAAPAASWPQFGAAAETAMVFAAPNSTGGGHATGAVDGEYKAKCGFWEGTGFDWIL